MTKQRAVIVDVDGTLVDSRQDADLVLSEPPDIDLFIARSAERPPMPDTLAYCEAHRDTGHALLVVTARDHRWLDLTTATVTRILGDGYSGPFCQPEGFADSYLAHKLSAYHWLSRRFEIVSAIDDDPAVIELWRRAGIPEVVQVLPTLYPESRVADHLVDLDTLLPAI